MKSKSISKFNDTLKVPDYLLFIIIRYQNETQHSSCLSIYCATMQFFS